MKDKYYQPTKEEFYIGFECEIYDDNDKTWDLVYIDTQPGLCNITGLDLDIRVKYLDRSDIEDLGFKQITDNCYNLPIGNEEFRLLFEDNILKIYLADKYSNMLFQGNVKNKSALKILLKQLNIK